MGTDYQRLADELEAERDRLRERVAELEAALEAGRCGSAIIVCPECKTPARAGLAVREAEGER